MLFNILPQWVSQLHSIAPRGPAVTQLNIPLLLHT